MKPETGIWGKLTRVVILLLCVAGALLLWQWYLPLIHQNERMRKVIHGLDEEVARQEKISSELQQSVQALTRDPKAVERLARETLGYIEPGETLIIFEPPLTNTVSPR